MTLAQPLFTQLPRETVRKGVLRQWLGTLPSMRRRAYQTDLSDAEWSHMEPLIPAPKAPGRPRVHTLRVRSLTPSSTSSKVAVPGAYCRTTSLLGKPSTITSGDGASTVPGRGCTPPCASGCGSVWAEILGPAPASSTAQSVKSTGVVGGEQRGYDGGKKVKGRKRHLLVEIRRVWYSKPRCTPQASWIGRGSRYYCGGQMWSSPVLSTFGWR